MHMLKTSPYFAKYTTVIAYGRPVFEILFLYTLKKNYSGIINEQLTWFIVNSTSML